VARWVRCGLSVAGPFVCRCLTSRTVPRFHRPLIEPDVQISRIRLSDQVGSRQSHTRGGSPLFAVACNVACSFPAVVGGTRLIATLPAVATSAVDLELRSLPSPGVTRLRRYYGPLRLPRRPGLSLAGVRLGHAPTTGGLPCCVRSPAQTCCRHYPGGTGDWDRFAPLAAPAAAFPVHWAGRLPR
jgi:hypothetical protein